MANFLKTSKTEKIITGLLILSLLGGLFILFIRENGFTPRRQSTEGSHLIEPKVFE